MADDVNVSNEVQIKKQKSTVLVIDDDESVLRLLSRFLKSEGHDVVCASSGSNAIELFKDSHFDLVITDMYMPEMDGLDIIRNIKDINVNVPIVVLTAAGSISNVVQSLKLGAFNYMTKPFNVAEVREIVQKALAMNMAHKSQKFFVSLLTHSNTFFKVTSAIDNLDPISFYMTHLLSFFGFKSTWQVQLALTEAFTNGVVHGNNYDKNKFVTVEITFNKDEVILTIEDEGEGFKIPDFKNYKLDDDIYACSGRGLFLINAYMDSVTFNEKGTRITMTKKRD